MSIITQAQFDEFSEAYPELADCYDLSTFTQPKDAEEELIAYTSRD
jgi:hypothetical protein